MTESPAADRGMSVIVKTVARWLWTPILVYGIYTVLYGHLSPGGGFAGGVMIATGLTLRTLAYGEPRTAQEASRARAAVLESAGALLFLVAAFAGLLTAGTFFLNVLPTPVARQFTLLSGGLIPVYNVGIALKVAGGLFVAFSALALMQRIFMPGGDGTEGT
ncbi:MAG: MnhB domain-containing protein [Myxococcota bacterium]